MKTSTILYRVRRPNQALYFGIYDPATRRIRTERTEQAATAVADEMGLLLEGEREVTHEQWLRLTGIVPEEEISPEQVQRDSMASLGKPPPAPASAQQPAPIHQLPRSDASDLSDDTLLLKRPAQRFSCFATENLPPDDDDTPNPQPMP